MQLAEQPALRTVEDYTLSDTQKIVAFADSKRADPLFNQTKLQYQATAALINAEFATDVLLPENDPTIPAEQSRQQIMENSLLAVGGEIPVSPRDNHPIHRQVLKAALSPIAQAAGQGDPKALQASTDNALGIQPTTAACVLRLFVVAQLVVPLGAADRMLPRQPPQGPLMPRRCPRLRLRARPLQVPLLLSLRRRPRATRQAASLIGLHL